MDYAIEYALMSELYDERCLNYLPATEGVAWDKIKGFFKRIWDWIVRKVGDLIAKLKKKPAPSVPSGPKNSGPLLLTASKNSEYAKTTGRDANGNPYTRVASDRNYDRERMFIDTSSNYQGKSYEFSKQVNQMSLHIHRLVRYCFSIMAIIEKHDINSGTNFSLSTGNIGSIFDHIDYMYKVSEELDAYVTGLNEIKAECIEAGLQMQMHHIMVDLDIKDRVATNLSEFKQHAEKMSMYMNRIDSLDCRYIEIIKKVSTQIQNSLVIIEKAVVALNSI